MVSAAWRTKLGNANSLENKVRAFVPGGHRVTTDRALDAGAGRFEDVNKDELSLRRNDHASRIIISRRRGQEKCYAAPEPGVLPTCFQWVPVQLALASHKPDAGGSMDEVHFGDQQSADK